MQVPIQISFHGCDHSDALELDIRKHIDKLEEFSGRIVSARVVVELPHRSHAQGKLFDVNIDVNIPGIGELVHHAKGANPAHEDSHVAVRDAFNALEAQIKKHVSKRRDLERKPHED